MNWLWVDAGNDMNWAKGQQHGIDGEFYAATDPAADLARRLEASRSRGHAGGLYTAWNWFPDRADGAGYAEWTHELTTAVETLLPVKTNSYPKIQLNNEDHRPGVILAMLRRWRELRPKKDTSWTFEGGQGGWMSPEFVAEVVALKVRLVPQLYNGPMTEVWDSLTFARDLTKRGFPDALISPFYDAGSLPVGWAGWAFTMGRLS